MQSKGFLFSKHFTYMQTYVIVCILFGLAQMPRNYYWFKDYSARVHHVDQKLVELEDLKSLKNFMSQLQKFRSLIEKQAGVKDDILKAEKDNLLNAMRESLESIPKNVETAVNTVNWSQLEDKWSKLIDDLANSTTQEDEILLHETDNDLLFTLSYLNHSISSQTKINDADSRIYTSILLSVPYLQEYLSLVDVLTYKIFIQNDKSADLLNQLIAYTMLIELNVNSFIENLKIVGNSNSIKTKEIKNVLDLYFQNINEILTIIQNYKNNSLSPDNLQLLFESLNRAEKASSTLLTQSLNEIATNLRVVRTDILWEMWVPFLISLFFSLCVFALGVLVTYHATRRLINLTNATTRFTNGELSIRVPILYDDEVGRQAQAFNRMAEKLEGIVGQLYELVDATTALSNWDLTVRIHPRENNSEFNQVANSFNAMAEIFETIISRLQQLGFTLTSSSSEIQSASKEQESIILDQEQTTREIAKAARDISTSAKDFAHTINDMNMLAGETSHLAQNGKDSLNNMEVIMRQMVDASGSIASKLAILNEKAGNITNVITTITKVADQTNLLSLNASIEAEKAGEFGRSFRVIAREIRRLADQTAIATLDIEKIVNEMMSAVSSSVMAVDDFAQEIRTWVDQVRTLSEQLSKIIGQVQIFTSQFELVNKGMQAQSSGAEQINEAIAMLSQIAQQSTLSLHQFHRTIQELNNAANELRVLPPFLARAQGLSQTMFNRPPQPSSSPTALETRSSMTQFHQTLSDLSHATHQLKDIQAQLKPPKDET